MNQDMRRRAKRGFLASLLQSDLSTSDMLDLAEDLMYGSFGRELGEFLRESLAGISDYSRGGQLSLAPSAQTLALDLIGRRRMSKRSVVQLMSLASPGVGPQNFPANATMKEMIDKYFMMAPTAEIDKFISILEGEPADPYIKGIARRDRAR